MSAPSVAPAVVPTVLGVASALLKRAWNAAPEIESVAPTSAPSYARAGVDLDGRPPDGMLAKTYKFKNYFETMAFVNAVAWIANTEDHHPDLAVGYSRCRVDYSTHAIGGLSENDFILAAKIDGLSDA